MEIAPVGMAPKLFFLGPMMIVELDRFRHGAQLEQAAGSDIQGVP
jgi:hypothetical protein